MRTTEQGLISSTEATAIAKKELPVLTEEQVDNVRVEEVELSDDGYVWLITLGYSTPDTSFGGSKYKTFKIQADNGRVLAMKMHRAQ